MAQPLYYLPGVQADAVVGSDPSSRTINRELLKERGLAHVFADVTAQEFGAGDVHSKGPDGLSGTIIHYCRPDGRIPSSVGMNARIQTWHKISDKLYIGTINGQEPTSDDLRRKRIVSGYEITTGIGTLTIPVIRRCADATSNLPSGVHKDPLTGKLARPILRDYRHLWDASADVCEWFYSEKENAEPTELPIERAYDMVMMAIGINYRVSEHEQALFNVFEYDLMMTIVAATVDYYGLLSLQDAQKKTESSSRSLNTTPGQSEDLTITTPVAAS